MSATARHRLASELVRFHRAVRDAYELDPDFYREWADEILAACLEGEEVVGEGWLAICHENGDHADSFVNDRAEKWCQKCYDEQMHRTECELIPVALVRRREG